MNGSCQRLAVSGQQLAEAAEQIKKDDDYQDGAQADTGASAVAPASVTVISSAAGKKQYQDDE